MHEGNPEPPPPKGQQLYTQPHDRCNRLTLAFLACCSWSLNTPTNRTSLLRQNVYATHVPGRVNAEPLAYADPIDHMAARSSRHSCRGKGQPAADRRARVRCLEAFLIPWLVRAQPGRLLPAGPSPLHRHRCSLHRRLGEVWGIEIVHQ